MNRPRCMILAAAVMGAAGLAIPAAAVVTAQAPAEPLTKVWLQHQSSNRCTGFSSPVGKQAPLRMQDCSAQTPAFGLEHLDGDHYRLTSPDGVNCVQSVADDITSSRLVALTPCADNPTKGVVTVRWQNSRTYATISTDGGRTCLYPHSTGVIPVSCTSVADAEVTWAILYGPPALPMPTDDPTGTPSIPPTAHPSLPPSPVPTITAAPMPTGPEPMPSVTVPAPTSAPAETAPAPSAPSPPAPTITAPAPSITVPRPPEMGPGGTFPALATR